MEKVVELLTERNRILKKFSNLNEKQLEHMTGGNYDNIDEFYHNREVILQIVSYIETHIREFIHSESAIHQVPNTLRTQVQACLKAKDEIVTHILEQDLELISQIEKAKTKIITELQSTEKSRQVLKYQIGIPYNLEEK